MNEALKVKESLFGSDAVKIGTEIVAAGLETVIGPAAMVLPMIQSYLGQPSDWKDEISSVLSSELDQREIIFEIGAIKDATKVLSELVKNLNATLNSNITENSIEMELARNDASIIQADLRLLVQKISNGDSLLWTHPKLVVQPLFALLTLISLFTPIRDALFHKVRDETIISCQMKEALDEYYQPIKYWRLSEIDGAGELAVFQATYNWETIFGGYNDLGIVRCSNFIQSKFDYIHLRDKVQNEIEYHGNRDCLVDYINMVSDHVALVFLNAKAEMEKSCSDAQKYRERYPSGRWNLPNFKSAFYIITAKSSFIFFKTGFGWFSFKKLGFWAYGEGSSGLFRHRPDCDLHTTESGVLSDPRCDPYIKIFIDGELSTKTKIFDNTEHDEITMDFRTKLIPKNSNITFQMWDSDLDSKWNPDDILLDKTYQINTFFKYDDTAPVKKTFYAGQRPERGSLQHCQGRNICDNFIEIYELI